MDKNDIHQMLLQGERIGLECKKAATSVPDNIWTSYSAFANTYGGIILLGIQENIKEKDIQKRFTINGVEDSDKIVKDLWNQANNPQKINVNLLGDNDVYIVDVDGKDIVVINVPRARYNQRPVYINNKMIVGNVFKRNHEGDYKCTQSEARNPKMQDMLRMIGLGENLGSGFPKILDAWKEAKWNAPILEDRFTTEEVRLTLPIPFLEGTKGDNNVPDNVLDKLTERQRIIYDIIKRNVLENENKDVLDNTIETTESLAKKLSVSSRTIRRDLDKMKSLGLVKREGGDFGGRWIIINKD